MILEKLLPIFIGLATGIVLRRFKVLTANDGKTLLKLVFYVLSPALFFHAVISIELDRSLLVFFWLGLSLVAVGFLVSQCLAPLLHLPRQKLGSFVIACMIANSGFTLPFLLAAYGTPAAARIAIFDLANGLLTFTWVYAIASRHNPESTGTKMNIRKILFSPPLLALALGLACNLMGVVIPAFLSNATTIIGAPTGMVIVVALGLILNFHKISFMPSIVAIATRMGIGIIMGLVFVKLYHLTGINRAVVLVLASAPIGYNVITFSVLEKLDEEFAATTVSLSIIISVIAIPLLLTLAK